MINLDGEPFTVHLDFLLKTGLITKRWDEENQEFSYKLTDAGNIEANSLLQEEKN